MAKLDIPIYVPAGTAGSGGAPSVLILPLSQLSMRDIQLSADHNCIGQYNSDAVTPAATCVDTDDTTCARWTTAGSMGGFITLDDANGVDIPQLAESLCVLLEPNTAIDTSNPNEKLCQTGSNGHVEATGDFCSMTDMPGGWRRQRVLALGSVRRERREDQRDSQPARLHGAVALGVGRCARAGGLRPFRWSTSPLPDDPSRDEHHCDDHEHHDEQQGPPVEGDGLAYATRADHELKPRDRWNGMAAAPNL